MGKTGNTRDFVQDYYGKAAQQPREDLCCPTSYPTEDIGHIPQEVIDRFYGCGSPMSLAGIKEGEAVVDLGSGAGIDCFIASKKAGASGHIIGVDMTDDMLKVANENISVVSSNLGYENVEFRKGYLEEIPVDNKSVDLITSNCVINLSPDKRKVFREMIRVLKDHGRIVVSDIISSQKVPESIRDNDELYGECIAGALTEKQFLSYLEQVGFYGIEVLSKTYWKSIENIDFCSITLRAYKFEKTDGCVFIGQHALYHGPFKVIIDEEGHVFPRNQAIEVCTDTAQKLSEVPYKGMFTILEPDQETNEVSCCSPSATNGNDNSCC
ncbi:MAG: methyltransferase domain-containing protein [Thermodesulfobacteriota bacterium]